MVASESWTAFRFEDCSRILRSAKTFSSTGYASTIGLVMGNMILGMDDPEHRLNRNLVAEAFREKSLARWDADLIAPICHELIDRFAGWQPRGQPGHGDHLRVTGHPHRGPGTHRVADQHHRDRPELLAELVDRRGQVGHG